MLILGIDDHGLNHGSVWTTPFVDKLHRISVSEVLGGKISQKSAGRIWQIVVLSQKIQKSFKFHTTRYVVVKLPTFTTDLIIMTRL